MKVLPRTEFGNPILRAKAKDVSVRSMRTPAFKTLVKDMIHTMRRADGVGLAAPQIGKPIRLAVMEMPFMKSRPELEKKAPIVILNPRIVSSSSAKEYDWEGCLSLRRVRGHVPRAKSITVEYLNADGKKVVEKASGLWARIFQHEIDHLDGIVYVDRMKDMKTLMTEAEYRKRVLKK
jgi:peptide deformylase